MLFPRKLHHFRLDSCIPLMFHKSVLQILQILPFGTTCPSETCALKKKLQSASRITGVDQVSGAQLYDQLIYLFLKTN